MKKLTSLSALLLTLTLASCGGGNTGGNTGGGTNNGGNTGGGTGNSDLRAKFAACPIAHTSEDPAAVSCLVGTYTGKTMNGDTCTLTIRADRSYDFKSSSLNYTYTPKSDSFSLFDHTNPAGDTHQVIWSMNDQIQAGTFYRLDLTARFGSYLSSADQYLEFKATRNNEPAVTCKSTL